MGSLADRVGGYIARVLDIEGCQSTIYGQMCAGL